MTQADQAAVVLALGVVQGITEFLPISSDGHLAAAMMLFAVPEASLAMTVLLHLGTLLATALVFRADLLQVARTMLREAARPAAFLGTPEGVLLRNLVLACVPTAIIGLTLEHQVEALSRLRWAVGAGFLVSAAAVVSTRGRSGSKEALSPGAAVLVGVLQGAAVLPGVSRSALTIATALALGLTPLAAFRFSFLLSLPAVAGAALLELHDPAVLAHFSRIDWFATVLSFVFGCAALLGLRRLLARGRFWMFSLYLVPLGAAMLAWDVLGGR